LNRPQVWEAQVYPVVSFHTQAILRLRAEPQSVASPEALDGLLDKRTV
jgi:hypothetical protein